MERIVLGFSGGVDSAVTALLLKRDGWDVRGVYFDNAGENEILEAKKNAEYIGIPLTVIDIHAELEEKVCTPFVQAYLQGKTPIPCIMCNGAVKFRNLAEYADSIGAFHISTGHYARTKDGVLLRGTSEKDQSYMLCRLTRQQVQRAIFPLGEMDKTDVRALAEQVGLPAAKKPDSQEICFIPDKDYRGWIERRGNVCAPGNFMLHGEVFGQHEGIFRYTVGQRLPGFFDGRKLYVSNIDAETDTIELAWWDELFKTEVHAEDFRWLIDPPEREIRASVRVRHTKWEQPTCTVFSENGIVKILCDTPVRAPAAGQVAALYDGDRVLGGGIIL
ncbi:MAG: tRNA 2-thiouridine(34) synthase MnmA [Clostridia bacterium]|nr:tRNA 2-thiouridine(34) synthase MnmA [Clostridia bacterium]